MSVAEIGFMPRKGRIAHEDTLCVWDVNRRPTTLGGFFYLIPCSREVSALSKLSDMSAGTLSWFLLR